MLTIAAPGPALFDWSPAMIGPGRAPGASGPVGRFRPAGAGGRGALGGPGGSGGSHDKDGPGGRADRAAPPVPSSVRDLLADAAQGLRRACSAREPADRFAIAHLAALRAAAAVVAARARPTRGRRGSVWTLMSRVAPEFAEWAAFFAAGSGTRQAVEAGLPAKVSEREADDMVRQVTAFIALVGDSVG